MKLKLNRHYKTLLILALVLGPFIWLVISADGQRRSDLVMLSLFTDREPMNLAFGNLQAGFGEAEFRRNLPEIPFQCADRSGHFGTRVCTAPIAAVNGAPAQAVSLYFDDGALNALKLVYQPAHQQYLLQRLNYDLGAPSRSGSAPDDHGVRTWDTAHGRVLLPLDPGATERPDLLWLSDRYLREAGSGEGQNAD
jgi:hypothetical protein